MTTIDTTAAAAADASKSAIGRSSLAKNFDTFLTMLTVQLKHQDPLSPMDSTQFTNQLVQFAGVEQQINANSNLEKLISATSLNTRSQSISYIGHYIEADTNQLPLQGGEEIVTNEIELKGGQATFNYTLEGNAATTKLQIKDANGNVVRTIAGDAGIGRHQYDWDGLDKDGEKLADGKYTVTATAVTSAGNAVNTTLSTNAPSPGAAFSYTLKTDAASCQVLIKDSAGNIVRTLTSPGSAGRHEVKWDGKNSTGKAMPDGAYTIEVAAVDGEKKNLDSAITVYGKVTDVSSDSSGTLLAMGKVVTTVENVLTVRDAKSVFAMAN